MKRPTVGEVADYVATREVKIDPQEFIDHYDSNGWMVGRTPMKNWKAAVHTWEHNERKRKGMNGHAHPAMTDAWIDAEYRAGRLKLRPGESYAQVRARLKQ